MQSDASFFIGGCGAVFYEGLAYLGEGWSKLGDGLNLLCDVCGVVLPIGGNV